MKRFTIFLTMVLSLCLIPAFAQSTIFVSPAGDDSNNGATWETAKATLAGALTAATGNTHIYMMVGNYACNDVIIPNGVTVTGGYVNTSTGTDTTLREYPGENSRWNNTTLCTILDANNTSRIATINTGGKLEGCVITKGKVTDLGGGVLIDGGTVMHCVLINNVAMNSTQTAKGGGVYIRNNGYLLNCVVAKNYADNGLAVAGTDGTLTNNTITANGASNCGTVTDDDGNVYSTVIIGSQCWMAENLRVTQSSNGQSIPISASSGASRQYPLGGSASSVPIYGYNYNWTAVMSGPTTPSGVRGICPVGWHVPSRAEWEQLTTYVNSQYAYLCGGTNNNIAKALASTMGWPSGQSATCCVSNQPQNNNATGFGAMPMNTNGTYVFYWSSTNSGSEAYCFEMRYQSSTVSVDSYHHYITGSYFPVRCLRD